MQRAGNDVSVSSVARRNEARSLVAGCRRAAAAESGVLLSLVVVVPLVITCRHKVVGYLLWVYSTDIMSWAHELCPTQLQERYTGSHCTAWRRKERAEIDRDVGMYSAVTS